MSGLAVGDVIDLASKIVTSAEFDGSTLTANVGPTAINISGLSSSYAFFFASDGAAGTDFTVEKAPTVTIGTIATNNIVGASEANAGFSISGGASDSSISLNGQTVTVDILNGSNVVVHSYTSTITGGHWSIVVPSTDTLADGTYTVTANVTDVAINPALPEATHTLTVDEDTGEQAALGVTVNGGTTLVQTSDVHAVAFSVAGLESDDNGTLTLSDGVHPTVTVTIANGAVVAGAHNTATTVDLSALSDDASISSTLALNNDAAGNSFTAVSGNAVTLDQDTGEQAALGVTVNGGTTLVQTSDVHAVAFSVAGLESDDNGTLTFSDGVHPTVTVTIANGAVVAGAHNTATTVDLSALSDDASISSTLALNNDAAGNSFTAVSGNAVTLDQAR